MKRGDRQHEKPVLLPAQTKYANYIVAHTDDTDAQNIHTRHTKKHAKVPVGIVGQTDRLTTPAYTALAQRRAVQILFKTQQKVYSKVIYNAVQHACQKTDNGKLTEMQSVTLSQLLRSVRSAPSRLVRYGVPAHL